MGEMTIKYGGSKLKLSKSPSLVGVKPARGRVNELERSVSRLGAAPTRQVIGGFEVVDVKEAARPMEETLDALRNEEAIAIGTHVYHTSTDQVPFVPTGQLYLVFKDDASPQECQKLVEQHSLEILEVRGERELLVRVTPDSPNPIKVAAALQDSPLVEVAEPDLATPGKLSAFVVPSDVLLSRQWHLRNTGTLDGSTTGLKEGADARVVAAWGAADSLGSRDVILAVIDDGFDLSHPDLSGMGKVVAQWDFTRNNSDPRPEFGPNYPYFDPNYQEWIGDWHGTACAGVAIGAANGSGILGAAPNCRLMPVRWGTNLADAQVEAWFDFVREQGAWVVSCSWGPAARNFSLSTRKRNAIARCAQEGRSGLGCIICFAAGNSNLDVFDPANDSVNGFAIHPDVIAVAASTSIDERSNYSNYGDAISVCAPSSGAGGRDILTADVIGTFSRNGQHIESGYSPGAYTYSFGGTSSATPLVAGVCALILTIEPSLSASQVKDLVQRTARKIGAADSYDENGHSRQFGYGCINAENAIKTLLQNNPLGAAKNQVSPSRRSWQTRVAKR